MTYTEAPSPLPPVTARALFLAGGITGCPDWQRHANHLVHRLDPTIHVLNPRRADFPIGDPDAAEEQIRWEHRALHHAWAILFWFPAENQAGCPIALYELGAWSMTDKPIAVGVEPGYVREQDVRIQTDLARPRLPVLDTLEATVRHAVDLLSVVRAPR